MKTTVCRWLLTSLLICGLLSFQPCAFAGDRLDPDNLMVFRSSDGRVRPVRSVDDWQQRRAEILEGMQRVMGPFPGDDRRTSLDVEVLEEVQVGRYVRRLITYQSEPGCRTPAYLCVPSPADRASPAAAVLCLHPTDNSAGHKVVVGLGGRSGRQYAAELAERGFVTLSPAYPHLANYWPNLSALGYVSGSMKAVWDNSRALDLLASLDYVDARPGFAAIGHSLGGHNAVYSAVFDDRISVVVTSCGFDSFRDYMGGDNSVWYFGKGWCQIRYMPRMSNYRGQLQNIPFDFPELLGALAPRTVFVSAPLHDGNFRWQSVDRCVDAARPVFGLFNASDRLIVRHPDCDHQFPQDMREAAYRVIEKQLRSHPDQPVAR